MKTDTIFYHLFQQIPSIFFELIGQPPELADFYQFSSIEVKQTAFRIDGVFVPEETTEHPIHFLEVQFQSDPDLYNRFFAEILIYIRQNKPHQNWQGVIIYPTRSIDTGDIKHFEEFFLSQRVRVIYLDEIEETTSLPIGIATIKLIIAKPNIAITQAKQLINRTKQEVNSQQQQQQLLDIIETILIYKFPRMNREEIEAMFGLSDLKQTRFYQEAVQEGLEEGERKAKLETVPRLLALGLSPEQIAQVLNLSIEEVNKIIKNNQTNQ